MATEEGGWRAGPDRHRVLHVLHTWGVSSQTFLRSSIRRTPVAAAELLCDQVLEGEAFPGRVTRIGAATRLFPRSIRGKVSVALGLATALRSRTDVLHVHFAHQLELASAIRRRTGRPLVASVYGRDLLVELRQDVERMALLCDADAVIALSGYLAGEAADLGVDPSRISVVPLGIDQDEFPPDGIDAGDHPGALRVLFVGRFVGKKGVLDAVDALCTACDAGTDLVARFVGSGPLEASLRGRIAATPGFDDRISIEPGDDRSAVLDAFRWADVVLSPSRTDDDGDRDTLLMVNLEAQACGVPVVTTRLGGIPEGVAPGAGILVEEGDVGGFAAAVASLAEDPERRRDMGRRGHRWIHEERTSAHTGRRVAAVYDAVVSGGQIPRTPPASDRLP